MKSNNQPLKTYRATVAEESLKNADEGRLKIPAILMLANEENEKKKKLFPCLCSCTTCCQKKQPVSHHIDHRVEG